MKNTLVQIMVIAVGVWKEFVRNKGVFTLVCTFLCLLLLSHVIASASPINGDRLFQTAGFFFFGIFGLLTNIMIGSSLIREINEKRVYMIMVRPIGRTTFLIGKFIGNSFALLSIFLPVTLIWGLLIFLNHIDLSYLHIITLAFILGEWIIIAAASLFFATFTTPLIHGLFLFFIMFAGHFSRDLIIYSTTSSYSLVKELSIYLFYIIPNLELINFRTAALYNQTIETGQIFSGLAIVTCWTGALVACAAIIFSRKKLS